MGENTFKKQIEEQLRNKFKEYFGGGCFWKNTSNNLTIGIVIDNIEQVIEKLVQIASQHSKLTNYKYDNNKSEKDNIEEIKKIINNTIMSQLRYSVNTFLDNPNKPLRFLNQSINLTTPISTKLQNGKIIERTFGTKENDQKYTPEEVKVVLKEAEEIECKEEFKDKRLDKFTFLSMIVDIENKLVQIDENNSIPIKFPIPDVNNKEQYFNNIKDIIKNAKQDPNSPNILLIPYSASNVLGGHIVTLVVDMSKIIFNKTTNELWFGQGSIKCFDSSHYFTTLFKSCFPEFLRHLLENNDDKGAINVHTPQLNNLELGTCSFYTEAFCYVISDYIRLNPKATLDEIQQYVNTPDVERLIEYYKNLFFDEYKATMEEAKQKQEQQKENIKKEIIKYKEQNSLENRQLTSDEQHYQQLLNQYGVYRHGQEFMGDINNINNSNPFNRNQQNALVREFIGSDVLTNLNNGNEIIVGFNHNREAFMNIIHDARQLNSVLNGGTAPVNFIYTLGTENNQNADAGTHYVAAQIFRDPITNELVVLHYDSFNGNIDPEFKKYIKKEFGENIQIVNVSNQNRFTQQNQGAYTCGLCALTALRDNGILDQERIKRCHLSKDDINLNTHNTPQQTSTQPQLSENFRGFIDIGTDNVPQRQQNQPSFQTQRTLPPPPPTPRSPSPSISVGNN